MSTTKNDTDKLVLELLAKVETKKQQIGNAERPSWQTHCSFKYNPENNMAINIQTVKDLSVLADIYAFLLNKKEYFDRANKCLGLDAKFDYLGFTFYQWERDIATRISSLQIQTKKNELAKLEERVNALVSPEQRRKIELSKLVKEIG